MLLLLQDRSTEISNIIFCRWKEYWHTDEHYKEGEIVKKFEYGGKTCVIGLCGDLWDFPERFALDEDILFWLVYISYTPEDWEGGAKLEYAEQAAKCAEKVLLVNPVCDGDSFSGAVFFENGAVKAELSMGEEGILFCEI